MADTPVVLLNGARQTGKTPLAQAIAAESGAPYFTLGAYNKMAVLRRG
jgi:chloramphenicol 3-O-phosphotransferase